MGNIKVNKDKELIDKMDRSLSGNKTVAPEKAKPLSEIISGIQTAKLIPEQKYEMVNHPSHYNNYDVEVVDMMERIWGKEATANWCKMTAFKYRMRMGTKPGSTVHEDLQKEAWYLNKAKELSE